MDAVPFADENQRQALMDSGRSIDTDVDGVTVVGYSPTLGPKRRDKSQEAGEEYQGKYYATPQLCSSLCALLASGEKFAHT